MTPFADAGDSGSLVFTSVKNDIEETCKLQGVGILHSLYIEDARKPVLAIFDPFDHIFASIENQTGLKLRLDGRSHKSNTLWEYTEHGAGRSYLDLK